MDTVHDRRKAFVGPTCAAFGAAAPAAVKDFGAPRSHTSQCMGIAQSLRANDGRARDRRFAYMTTQGTLAARLAWTMSMTESRTRASVERECQCSIVDSVISVGVIALHIGGGEVPRQQVVGLRVVS